MNMYRASARYLIVPISTTLCQHDHFLLATQNSCLPPTCMDVLCLTALRFAKNYLDF